MSAVVHETREGPSAQNDAPPRPRLVILRRLLIDVPVVTALDDAGMAAPLDAQRVLEAQTGGTRVVRADDVVCRALKEAGTLAAFALWNGPGM